MQQNDELVKLKAKREYLIQWYNRYKQAHEVVPFVQMELEIIDWEIEALANRPEEASEIPIDSLITVLDRDTQYIQVNLPLMPEYNRERLFNSTAVTTTGSSTVYEYVTRVGDLGTEKASEYSAKFAGLYQNLQEVQDRISTVRRMIERLNNPNTLHRFERALNAYQAAKAGVGERTSAAFEIRTLMDGVQGDLFNKARKWIEENMTWTLMAERLIKEAPLSIEYQELIQQNATRGSLISRLSDIGKDRKSGSLTNLDNVWTQVLDHLFTTLVLVGLQK